MVQPYQSAIDANGEVALIYFDHQFSHAVSKQALLRPDVGEIDRLWEQHVITSTEATENAKAWRRRLSRRSPGGSGRRPTPGSMSSTTSMAIRSSSRSSSSSRPSTSPRVLALRSGSPWCFVAWSSSTSRSPPAEPAVAGTWDRGLRLWRGGRHWSLISDRVQNPSHRHPAEGDPLAVLGHREHRRTALELRVELPGDLGCDLPARRHMDAGLAAPGTPAQYNKVGMIKVGPSSAKNVLVLEPGTSAGRRLLRSPRQVDRLEDSGWQVWAVERRENLLEDQSELNLYKDHKVTASQLYDYYLGYLKNPTITHHYQPVANSTCRVRQPVGNECRSPGPPCGDRRGQEARRKGRARWPLAGWIGGHGVCHLGLQRPRRGRPAGRPGVHRWR